jgi:hypothetical protein
MMMEMCTEILLLLSLFRCCNCEREEEKNERRSRDDDADELRSFYNVVLLFVRILLRTTIKKE